jgi:segregation and condensation protein A
MSAAPETPPAAEPPVEADGFTLDLTFQSGQPGGDGLIVDVEGFEGPLDLLLNLARSQRVDLRRISIVRLVDQYVDFIANARRLELDLAADYLVMASWLAYLKSRLLLPQAPKAGDEPSGEELAARLAFRLQRLEAMRQAAARLMARDRLGRDVFFRGAPEGVRLIRTPRWSDTLVDLLKAYSNQRLRTVPARMAVKRSPVFAIEDARKRLEAMLGIAVEWSVIEAFIPDGPAFAGLRRSALASMFSASLEMAKDGKIELRQTESFAPIYLRAKKTAP